MSKPMEAITYTCYGSGSGEITGSCHGLRVGEYHMLIDAGLRQEGEGRNTQLLKSNLMRARTIAQHGVDAAIVTHAHADHAGLFPALIQNGMDCDIHATGVTAQCLPIALKNGLQIQLGEWARYKKEMHEMHEKKRTSEKKADRSVSRSLGRCDRPRREERKPRVNFANKDGLEMYTMDHVIEAQNSIVRHDNNTPWVVADRISVAFTDAAHIMGSAGVTIKAPGQTVHLSGDLGNAKKGGYLGEPQVPTETIDTLILESTYGDKHHQSVQKARRELKERIIKAIKNHQNIVIPVFALERSLEVTMFLNSIANEMHEKAGYQPDIYLQSPLAREYMDIGIEHILSTRHDLADLGLLATEHYKPAMNPDEVVKQVRENAKGSIIMAASGMCDAGQIRTIAPPLLEDSDTLWITAGFPGVNTTHARLVRAFEQKNGERVMNRGKQRVNIQAQHFMTDLFSGHADRSGLLNFATRIRYGKNARIILTHGSNNAREELRAELVRLLNGTVREENIILPNNNDVIELLAA